MSNGNLSERLRSFHQFEDGVRHPVGPLLHEAADRIDFLERNLMLIAAGEPATYLARRALGGGASERLL